MLDSFAELDQCIKNYIDTPKPDYAIMLSGAWGIGKTYYFQNLKNQNYKQIYLSLAGHTDKNSIIHQLKIEFISIVFGQSEKTIDKKLSKIYKLFKSLIPSKYKILKDTIEPISDLLSEYFIDKIIEDNKENLIIVLDDLERYKGEINEILAEIHNIIVTKGGLHIIYIANETEIEEDYQSTKEKYIRHTISFSFPDYEAFKGIVCNYRNTNFYSFFNSYSNLDVLVRWMKDHSFSNLRNFIIAIEGYNFFTKDYELDNNNICLCFFMNLLISVNFSKSNLENDSFQDFINKHKFNENGFYLSTNPQSMMEGYFSFNNFKVLSDYVEMGYVPNMQRISFMEQFFPRFNESAKALFKLTDEESMEEEELRKTVNTLLNGIKKKDLPFGLLKTAATYLEGIERYLPEFDDKHHQDLIIEAIKDTAYPRRSEILKDESNIRTSSNCEFTVKIVNELKKQRDQFIKEKQKETFRLALKSINTKMYSELFEDEEIKRNFFILLIESDSLTILPMLNNKGIYNLQIALTFIEQSTISKEQRESLLMIKEEIEKDLSQFETNSMAYKRRMEFVTQIKNVLSS